MSLDFYTCLRTVRCEILWFWHPPTFLPKFLDFSSPLDDLLLHAWSVGLESKLWLCHSSLSQMGSNMLSLVLEVVVMSATAMFFGTIYNKIANCQPSQLLPLRTVGAFLQRYCHQWSNLQELTTHDNKVASRTTRQISSSAKITTTRLASPPVAAENFLEINGRFA